MTKRSYRKKSGRKSGKKGSRKGSKKSRRFKVDPSNRCTTNKKAQCLTDPNCTYVKKRGCRSRQGTVTGGLVFEGPMGPPMRIKKRKSHGRKGSKRHSKRKSHRKSHGRKGSKKSSRRRKGSKRYSKRR